MKVKDLKQGMVGELRSGESITVLDSGYYFINGLMISTMEEKYNEDLTHKGNKDLDIIEITYGDKVVFKRNESRWFVPEDGERYYFIRSFGDSYSFSNSKDNTDYEIFNTVKVFKTKEEAEKRLRQQQATLSVERWITENDVEVDVCDTDITKYYIVYDIVGKELKVDYYYRYITRPKQFTLSSEEKGLQLIKEREKELKIMFGVEE